MVSILTNEIHFIEVLITDINGRVDGLEVTYTIARLSDEVIVSSGTLTNIGNGIYKTGISISLPGQYRVEFITPPGYGDQADEINVIRPDTVEQYDIPGSEVCHSTIVASRGSNILYSIFNNSPPGNVSDIISTLNYCNVSIVAKTTGRVDIVVSNDRNMWVGIKNIYDYFAGDISGYGFVKFVTVNGYTTLSICLSNRIG